MSAQTSQKGPGNSNTRAMTPNMALRARFMSVTARVVRSGRRSMGEGVCAERSRKVDGDVR